MRRAAPAQTQEAAAVVVVLLLQLLQAQPQGATLLSVYFAHRDEWSTQ